MTWKLAEDEPEHDRKMPEPVAPIEPAHADDRVTPIFPRFEPPETVGAPSNPTARRRWGLPVRKAKEEYPAPTNDQAIVATIPVPAETSDKTEAQLADEVSGVPLAAVEREPLVEEAVPASPPEEAERVVVVYNGGGMRDVGPGSHAPAETEIATPRRA